MTLPITAQAQPPAVGVTQSTRTAAKGRLRVSTHQKSVVGIAAADPAGEALVSFLLVAQVQDVAEGRGLISNTPPGLPPPPPPSWLRQWTIELLESLQHKGVSHAMDFAPLRLLRLGTTILGMRRGQAASNADLRCNPIDAGFLRVRRIWQGSKGDVLLGVERRCPTAGGGVRWLRLAVRCNSQGVVERSFGVVVELAHRATRFPLDVARLSKNRLAIVALQHGGWLLQLAYRATQIPAPRGGTAMQPRRRLLLAIDQGGGNGTLLFDGAVRALPTESAAPRTLGERGIAASTGSSGVALGAIWQTAPQKGTDLWLQTIGQSPRPGELPREAGIALWRHSPTAGWQRQALVLPRTADEGTWLCLQMSATLRCTFQVPSVPGIRGFDARTLRPTSVGWNAIP